MYNKRHPHLQVLGTEALGTSLDQRDHLANSDPVFHLFFGWRGSGTGRDANFGLYYHNLKNSKKQKINVCLSTELYYHVTCRAQKESVLELAIWASCRYHALAQGSFKLARKRKI